MIVVNSVLSGGLVLPCLFGIWWYQNYLWQEGLWQDCVSAMEKAQGMGFAFAPRGLGPKWVMIHQNNNEFTRIEWRGGLFGEYCVIKKGKKKRRCPLLCSAEDLISELAHLEPTSTPQL